MNPTQVKSAFNLKREGAGLNDSVLNDRQISYLITAAQRALAKKRIDALKNRTGRDFKSEIRRDEVGSLLSAHTTFKRTEHAFMKGDSTNGALKTPDLDKVGNEGVEAYGCFVNIPDEVMYYTVESCTISKGGKLLKNVPVDSIDISMYNDLIYDVFKQPYDQLVWGVDWGSWTPSTDANTGSIKGVSGVSTYDESTEVILETTRSKMLIPGNGCVVEEYQLFYIKFPDEFVIDVRNPANAKGLQLPTFLHEEIIDLAVLMSIPAEIPISQRYNVVDKEVKEAE
jgi:hypothetical protein